MRLYNQLLLHGLCSIMLGLAIVSAQDNVFILWVRSYADFQKNLIAGCVELCPCPS